jgi:phage repressor protein C with HTH and peptisase S24 domain
MSSTDKDICRRIARLRLELAGPRGKSSFARQLGISGSTYDYYEASRVPPAGILVKIADLAGVDLRWLLTGEASEPGVSASHPAIQRAAKLLDQSPDAAGPLAAFVDLLAEVHEFPGMAGAETVDPQPPSPVQQALPTGGELSGETSLIPVLGRSAAGVPQFWSGCDDGGATHLADLIDQHAGRPIQTVQAAALDGDEAVQIVTLREVGEDGIAQFLRADAIAASHPDAFALRIDGDSMSPEILHGDLVVLSPSAPALDGRPAVVQLADQIGVTCKLYRRDGQTVHLVAINEQIPPVTVRAEAVVWAFRLLSHVRPG